MSNQRAEGRNRREFLSVLALAGTAGLLGLHPKPAEAEPPAETTSIRLAHDRAFCVAPQFVAEELLQDEGFTEVRYVRGAAERAGEELASGEIQISMVFSTLLIVNLDMGDPIVALAGGHAGCFSLIASDQVRSIRDLKGKTVAVGRRGDSRHLLIAGMVAYVGLDPRKDINWVTHPPAESMRLLAEGQIDAFLGFSPYWQELQGRGIGHELVNLAMDRPWSQYFCCMVVGNREWVRKYPIATRRALRAILKATDMCALEPNRVARLLVDKGYVRNYNFALRVMKDIPYHKWRDYDPEDTVRFYALRLHEAGMIKSTPQKLIAQGTDWRFFNELKRELKG